MDEVLLVGAYGIYPLCSRVGIRVDAWTLYNQLIKAPHDVFSKEWKVKCTGQYCDSESEIPTILGLAARFRDALIEVIYAIYAIEQVDGYSGSDFQHSELGMP